MGTWALETTANGKEMLYWRHYQRILQYKFKEKCCMILLSLTLLSPYLLLSFLMVIWIAEN